MTPIHTQAEQERVNSVVNIASGSRMHHSLNCIASGGDCGPYGTMTMKRALIDRQLARVTNRRRWYLTEFGEQTLKRLDAIAS